MGRASGTKGPPRRFRNLKSVYPRDWAREIVGNRAVNLNPAIECWAQVMGWATGDNERMFNETEFRWIAAVVSQFEFDTRHPAPGRQIAMLMEGPAWADYAKLCPGTAKRVEKMDYIHAWALLWACNWSVDNPDVKEWWKLEARHS